MKVGDKVKYAGYIGTIKIINGAYPCNVAVKIDGVRKYRWFAEKDLKPAEDKQTSEVKLLPCPLLIAKQKDAKFLKDDYKLGWLCRDDTGYLWTVWSSSRNLENAMKVAKQVVTEKANGTIVYLSETPLERDKVVYEPLLELREVDPCL